MGFTAYYFILFPTILIIFYITRNLSLKASTYVLLISSIAFLFYVDIVSLAILFTLSIVNYGLIHLMIAGFNKAILRSIGIVLSLLPLIIFKYSLLDIPSIYQFETETILSFAMPLGLAFYSLQQITALFDATKQHTDKPDLKKYLLFSFLFIYLPSGPLTPYRKIVPQFNELEQKNISLEQINMGISLFIVGFSKKVLLADPIGEWINAFYRVEQTIGHKVTFSLIELSYIGWGSVLQFYFEFSAYSDMAIGMALCFGILLPVNFNSPLKAKGPIEYISSWHMSIMAFVREYVFQPVFMRFKKLPYSKMETRVIIAWSVAVFSTFFVTGVWHAPTQSAIFYSLFGALILVTLELLKRFVNLSSSLKFIGLGNIFSRVLLLFVIILTSIAFRAPSDLNYINFFIDNYSEMYISLPKNFETYISFLSDYSVSFHGIFPANRYFTSVHIPAPIISDSYILLHLLIATFIVFAMPNTMNMFNLIKSDKFTVLNIQWSDRTTPAIFLGVLFCISLLFFTNNTGFLYG